MIEQQTLFDDQLKGMTENKKGIEIVMKIRLGKNYLMVLTNSM